MDPATEVKELYAILKGILNNDNSVRLQAEEKLKTYLVAPAKLLQYLVKLMQDAQEDYIRKLASVLFKHYIALEEASSFWGQIPFTQQEAIKTEILVALRKELNPKVAKQICQAVAELAGLLFDQEKDWPQLDELLAAYISSNDLMAETSFRILSTLFALNSDKYMKNVPAVCGLFDAAFQKTSSSVLAMASIAICTLVAEIDTAETKPFLKYSAPVIKTIQQLFTEDNEDTLHELLDSVSEMSEAEPTFFRKTYAQLCDTLIKVSGKKDFDNDKLRQMPLEILVSILERLPNLAKKYKPQLWGLCSAMFDVMVSIDEDVDPAWMKPKEGYNIEEDMNPDDNVNFGANSFDRLLGSIDDDDIFPVMEKVMETSMSSVDWRYRNAGLMSIGQIGEYCDSVDKVRNLIPILVSHVTHAHPKVRFAALSAIGLLADYMHPEFQEEFGKILLPPMIAAMDDTVPRVTSQTCAAMSNFFDHAKQSTGEEVAPVLLPKLIKAVREGISIVKENAMSCISSLADCMAEKFLPYYKEFMAFLSECVKQLASKEYHQFCGLTIECMTMVSAAVGKAAFAEFGPGLISMMVALQETELTKDDPQRIYLLESWQRLCILMEKDFAPYLPRIVPGLMKIAGAIPGMGVSSGLSTGNLEEVLKEVSGSKDDSNEVNTSEMEEKLMAIQMLQTFAENLEDKYAQYVEETTKILEPLLVYRANSDVRKQSAMMLPSLLKCLHKASIPQPALVSAGSKYIADILQAHDKEIHADIKSAQVLALKEIFELLEHFMTAEDTKAAIMKVLGFFKTSEDRKSAILRDEKACKDDEDEDIGGDKAGSDDEADEVAEDSVESEELYQRDLTYLLGAIVNGHKDESLPEVPTILSHVVQPYLSGNKDMQRAALFIVDDLLEYLGSAKLGVGLWKQLATIVLTYLTRSEHELRQAACYGVGMMAKSGGPAFAELSVQCLTLLAAAIDIKQDKRKPDEWTSARENGISSIGKILKYQPATVTFGELWAKWLGYLPLKEDKPEAKFSHELVVETLLANPAAAVGVNGALLGEIIRIFVAVYDTKLTKKTTKAKIAQAMKQLSGYAELVPIMEDIYKNKLKPDDKAVLEKIINAGK